MGQPNSSSKGLAQSILLDILVILISPLKIAFNNIYFHDFVNEITFCIETVTARDILTKDASSSVDTLTGTSSNGTDNIRYLQSLILMLQNLRTWLSLLKYKV